jgi:hypothetical protein
MPADPPDPPDPDGVKASLRLLADGDERVVIERAGAATRDLETAAEFVESTGLEKLAAAVESVDDPDLAARGERALSTFREFREAAAGRRAAADHFRPGRGTDLRRADEPGSDDAGHPHR